MKGILGMCLATTLAVVPTSARAQESKMHPFIGAGVTMFKVTDIDVSGFAQPSNGFLLGVMGTVGLSMPLSSNVSIEPAVTVIQKGHVLSDVEDFDGSSTKFKETIRETYAGAGVNVVFSSGSNGRGVFGLLGGDVLSKLSCHASLKVTPDNFGSSQSGKCEDDAFDIHVKSLDTDLNIGVGYGFGSASVQARYSIGLSNVNDNSDEPSHHNKGFLALFTVRF